MRRNASWRRPWRAPWPGTGSPNWWMFSGRGSAGPRVSRLPWTGFWRGWLRTVWTTFVPSRSWCPAGSGGKRVSELISPRSKELAVLGLGGSVGTPPEGIRAEVLVVESYSDLEARASEARGKIVLFDVPFTSYGETVQYRSGGAVAAAKAGAVASLIRSVTPFSMNTPHTGGMSYEEGVPQDPPRRSHPGRRGHAPSNAGSGRPHRGAPQDGGPE